MNREIKTLLTVCAVCVFLFSGCGGSGQLTEFDAPTFVGSTRVKIVAMATTSCETPFLPSISKDASDRVGGSAGGSGSAGFESIEDAVGAVCEFDVERLTYPGGRIQVFSSNHGFDCSHQTADPSRCIYCEMTWYDGHCVADCEGYVPLDPEFASEKIMISVTYYSRFQTQMKSLNGGIGIEGRVMNWPEIELGSEDAPGVDLTRCSGGDDYMKAETDHPASFEELLDDEWHCFIGITDPGQDKDYDGLTNCDILSWFNGYISLEDVIDNDSVTIIKGPLSMDATMYEEIADCPWAREQF